jgi:RNA polymerase sigma factor (TIGR02999 family)
MSCVEKASYHTTFRIYKILFPEAFNGFFDAPQIRNGLHGELVLSLANLMSDVTIILDAVCRGDEAASKELLPLVYNELRQLAVARMMHESPGHTLQPTALVHEAWLRLVSNRDQNWKGRAYFFAAAAEAMRRILVEHARRKARLKHGGGQQRLNIEDLELSAAAPDEKILLVNEALDRLEKSNPERARIVVLKFFGGMTNKEAADSLGMGERSVERHWMCAKAWLFEQLQEGRP